MEAGVVLDIVSQASTVMVRLATKAKTTSDKSKAIKAAVGIKDRIEKELNIDENRPYR